MNLNLRRILLIASVAFFSGLAPLMVLYSMGVRFPSGNGAAAESVGVILVESNPRRASVYIDGNYRGQTPHALTNLKPGTVTVRVVREGFTEWQKTVTVQPGRVSDYRSIQLFPVQPQHQVLARGIDRYSLSPNRSLFAILKATTLDIYDEDGQRVFGPINVPPRTESLLWSPDSNSLILRYPAGISILDLTASPLQPESLIVDPLPVDVIWDQRVPGRMIYLDLAGSVFAYHYPTDQRQLITSNARLIATSASHLYAVYADNTVQMFDLRGTLFSAIDTRLPAPINKFMVTPGGRLALISAGSLYVYQDREMLKISDRVLKAGWSPDERLIYFQTEPNSIYIYNLRDDRLPFLAENNSALVMRLSRPITDPQWFAGGRHFIYQLGDEIHVTEIDTRGIPHDYVINTTNLGRSEVAVGVNGKEIFYLQNQDGNTNLLRTPILPEDSIFDFLP